MQHDVYLDESGDLGWSLDLPYRGGGSSKYFTLAYIILPADKNKHINRLVKKFHKDRSGSHKEVKGADMRNRRAESLARQIIKLFEWNDDIIIGATTVSKVNAPIRISETGNGDVLYNHMMKMGLSTHISSCAKVNIIPDQRSVPRGSQNSCSDLIKSEVWLTLNSDVEINYSPQESHLNERLMFIDWVANFVWRHYEDGRSGAYQILKPFINDERLFF